MGLMLGEFVDEYTVNVIDVFAMPQSGTVRCAEFRTLQKYQLNCLCCERAGLLFILESPIIAQEIFLGI